MYAHWSSSELYHMTDQFKVQSAKCKVQSYYDEFKVQSYDEFKVKS